MLLARVLVLEDVSCDVELRLATLAQTFFKCF